MKKKGFTQIWNDFIRDHRISQSSKVVYIYIKSFNPSFPSYSKIKESTGIKSDSTISKSLRELESFNIIKVKKGHKGRCNQYSFTPPDQWRFQSKRTISIYDLDLPFSIEATPNTKETPTFILGGGLQ